jgi:hypothetical protein
MQEKNHFPEPNRHMLTFFNLLQGHVLSTSGDALRKFHSFKNILPVSVPSSVFLLWRIFWAA